MPGSLYSFVASVLILGHRAAKTDLCMRYWPAQSTPATTADNISFEYFIFGAPFMNQ
jgi:hypothetical protein